MTAHMMLEPGTRFGMLTLIRFARYESGHPYWYVRCDCGTEAMISSYRMRAGVTMSCGCLSSPKARKNAPERKRYPVVGRRGHPLMTYPGMRYGRLVVIRRVGTDSHKHPIWECQCDCGAVKAIKSSYLQNGQVKSCGCLRVDRARYGIRNRGFVA